MATVAARFGAARPVHPTSCRQHSKPIKAPAHCQAVQPWRLLAAPAAATPRDSTAATMDRVEPKKHKMKLPKPATDALYLLTWGEVAGLAGQDVHGLRNDLKVLEKVSKEAVWFTVKEGQAGGKWVLVVTQDAKHARKYGLTELKGDVEQISLAGLDEPVTIPVAALKEAVMKAMDEDSSDSSSDEEEGMMAPAQKRPQAAATQLPAGLAEEDPAAALQAAALLGGSATMPTTKEERRKLGDAVKDLRRPAAQQMIMDGEDDSSSSSSSGSESDDCEEEGGNMAVIKPTQLETAQVQPARVEAGGKMEEDESSSDSSESDCDEEEVKMDLKKMDKDMKKSEKKRAKEEKKHRKLRGGESGELMEGSDYC